MKTQPALIRRWQTLLLLAAFMLVSACQHPAPNSAKAASDVITSDSDHRHYRYVELPNHLRVLLISAPNADKAAAALDVNVGSRQDPAERQGLAHFLEHMLFLGTDKYPQADENEYYKNDYQEKTNLNYERKTFIKIDNYLFLFY